MKKKNLFLSLLTVILVPAVLAGTTTFTSQSDWQEGLFDLSTADRKDNSGDLGIGYQNSTDTEELQGFWRLDTTSGGVTDYSGTGNSGEIYGALRDVPGIFGTNAMEFQGSADEVVIPDSSSLDLNEGFTLNAWVKPDETLGVRPSMSSNPEIIGKGDSYSLRIEDENYIAFSQNSNLKLMNSTGHISNLGIETSVIGPLADYDQDGSIEIPYVDGSGNLNTVDESGSTTNLASGAKASRSTLGAGDFDDDEREEIYFIDSSTSELTEYDFYSGSASVVGSGITATAVSGVADYDGDGQKDVIYLDGSQTVSWWNGTQIQSTGKSVAGENNFQYWIGGTAGPEVEKYEDGSWTDLSGKNNAPINSIYSGTDTNSGYFLGGSGGEVTKWDGSFTDLAGGPANQVRSLSSNKTHLLATAGTSVYTYSLQSGTWTDHGGVKSGPSMYGSAHSYGSDQIGDYWLVGHSRTGGTPKARVSKFDSTGFTRISDPVFENPVRKIGFNGTHYMGGGGGGNIGIYDGSDWSQPNTNNPITNNGKTIYSIEWGTVDGDSFWLVGGGGYLIKIQEDGTVTDLGKPTGSTIYSIEYKASSEKFFIGDGSGNVLKYDSGGLTDTGNTNFGNSLRTLIYNPSSAVKKMGDPSDLDNDGEVEVPIVNSNSNLALVPDSGSMNTIDSNYENAKASPLGTVDRTGNPSEEIIHINSNSDTLYLSDLNGNEKPVNESDGTSVTGVDQSPGISAGSISNSIPVLRINGQSILNRGGQGLKPGSWTMITATYNASTGTAELYFNSTLTESKSTGLGTVNSNSKDFKIANGKLNASIDEVKAYNNSLSSSEIERLFFNGSDGQFDGSYNSSTIKPEGKKSWNNIALDANISAETSLSATVYSLDSSNNILNTENIAVSDGLNNYSISGLENSKKVKFSLHGYSTDIKDTWEIFGTDLYYEESFVVGNNTDEPFSHQHKFNISATATGADSDNQFQECTAYYHTDRFTGYSSVENGGGTPASLNKASGNSETASCNATISRELFGVSYPNQDEITFKFNFTDNDGYTKTTENRTRNLPNNQPQINNTDREVSTTDHKFNFSAVGYDRDQGSSEIQSCTVYAEDGDSNTSTLGSLDTGYGGADQASCNATITDSLTGFSVGESIQVYAEFTDVAGATKSTSIYSETIPNHNPTVETGPTVEKASGEHAFNVSAVGSDSDSDSTEINSCTVYAEDGDGNTEIITGSGPLNQNFGTTDQASCNTSISNSIENFTVGESITVNVKFSDRHGAETQNATGTQEIPNEAPNKPTDINMSYFLSSKEDLDHLLDHTPEINWSNPDDAEGDQITVKAYTGSSPNPTQLDNQTNSSNKLTLGQNIGLNDGTTYNVSLKACDPHACSSYTTNTEFTVNEEPSINSVDLNDSSPTGNDIVDLEANITDSQDSIEWVNFTVYNQTAGTQIYSNTNGSLNKGLWNSDSFKVLAGNTYNWTLDTSDGYQTSSNSGTFSVSNSAPEIVQGLTATDFSNAHKFNASAVAYEPDGEINIDKYNITLKDGDGNQETFSRQVNKAYGTSSEVAANFSNVNSSIQGFEVKEEISTSIKFIDKEGKTATTSGTNRIPNKAPEIPQNLSMTYFLNENADINHVIDHTPEINWSNPDDAEGDQITVKAYTGQSSSPTSLDKSLNIGTNYGGSSRFSLGNSVSLSDGNSYNVTLIACDSYECSSRSDNIEFRMNEEPVIENTALNDSSPTGSDFVKLLSNATDNEDSISNVEFKVWNEDDNTRILSDVPGEVQNGEWNSEKFEVFASKSYNWTVNATDGYQHAVGTGSFSVPNTAPSMVSGPSFQDYSTGHKFNVSAVANDVDGQVNFANHTIQLNDGEKVYEYTRDVTESHGGPEEVAANFSNVNSSIQGFEVGETVFVTVIFRDKSGQTTQNFESHNIPNHAPDPATNINMSQLLEPGTDLQHVVDQNPEIKLTTGSDPDNDNLSFKVFTGSSADPTAVDRDILVTENNYTTSREIELGKQVNLNDGTTYNFSVEACDTFGSCTSKRVIQEFHTNQEPTFNSVELNKSSSELSDGDEVHLTANISDAESDSIERANFTAYNQSDNDILVDSVNGSINQNGNWISDTWKVSTGTTYNWTVNTTDSYETSETSGTFKTNNSNPEIVSGPSFDDITGKHAFNVSAVVKDDDGDGDLLDYTLVLEDRDGNRETVEESITDTEFGDSTEASITYSNVNTSIENFNVGDDIETTITARDDAGATAETPTRSYTIPNEVPGKPKTPNMTYFLQEKADLNHVTDHTPEINWTNPTDSEGDEITVKAYTETSPNPRELDNTTTQDNELTLGQNVEILDGDTYNVTLKACDPYGCSGYTDNIEFTMNQEPFIETVETNSSSITGSDSLNLEANITDSQDSIKWVNFTIYNQTAGTQIYSNTNGSLNKGLWNSHKWETKAETTYNYTVNASDGYQPTSTTGTVTVNNQQPEITGLSTANYDKGHKFNISAKATDADGAINIEHFNITVSDGDGNQEEIKASVNRSFGGEDEAALNYSNINSTYFKSFEVEETLSIDAEAIDKSGASASSSTENSIPNHVPELPQNLDLEVGNQNFVVNHTFDINWTNPSDKDGDNLTVKAYLGTSQNPLTIENRTEISSTDYTQPDELEIGGNNVNLQDNEDYVIDLLACDNWGCTGRDTNASFHMNQEPRIESVEINESVSEEAEWIKLIANVTATDNPLAATFYEVWNQSSPQKVVDEKIDSTSGKTWNSSAFYGKSLETYNWTFKASDGFENSTLTDQFKVGNAEPEITRGTETSDLKNEHGFNISAKIRDLNGDSDLDNYTVIADDGENTARYTENFSEDGDEYAWANYSNINSSINGFEVGETVSVQIIARDEQGLKAYSSTVSNTIPNRAPVITSIDLKPDQPTTEDTLNVSYTVQDPEEDQITNSFYEWKSNSSTVTSETVTPADTEKGQHWNLSLQIVDEYNTLSQENKSSETLPIQNSPPEIAKRQEIENITGEHAYTVSTVVQDPNGEKDLKNNCEAFIQHGNNNKTVEKKIDTTYTGSKKAKCSHTVNASKTTWLKPEEKVNTTFTFNDTDKAQVTSNTKTGKIPNNRPSIENLKAPENNSKTNKTEITFKWEASDPENDNLEYKLEIFNETQKINTSTGLTQSQETVKGLKSSNLSWKVTATDRFDGKKLTTTTSDRSNVLADSKAPVPVKGPQIEVLNSTRTAPLQNQSVKCYSKWSDNFELGDAEIHDNSTEENTSISKQEFSSGWANRTIEASELKAGNRKCSFQVSDHLNNPGSSRILFDVEDIEKPNITGFNHTPETQKDLDPNKSIQVNATITDNLELDNVSLLYRKKGGKWKQGDLTSSGDLYTGNFTPRDDGETYEFKYEANDTYGNEISKKKSVNISWDYTWSRTPAEYSGSSTLENNLIDYTPTKIENTGDFPLKYSITKVEDPNLELQTDRTNLTVPAQESEALDIEAYLEDTSADNEGIYSFQIKMEPYNETSSPESEGIAGQATFTLDAAFLSIEKGDGFPLSINQGAENVELPVDTTNIGTEKSESTEIDYSLSSDWSLSSTSKPKTQNLGNISVDEKTDSSVSFNVPEDASTGTKNIDITTSTGNRSFTQTFQIEVSENRTTTIIEEDSGGAITTPSDGQTNQEQVSEASDRIFNTTKNFELVRGQDQNFSVVFTNPTDFNLSNITVEASGFRSQYLDLKKEYIDSLEVNDSENISVEITAPDFFASSSFDIDFKISGTGYDPDAFINPYFNFTLNKQVGLEIHEISETAAQNLTEEMENLKKKLNSSGIPDTEIEKILSDAEEDIQEGEYGTVQDRYEKAESIYETATDTQEGLEELGKQIDSAEMQGLDVTQAKRMANLAEEALERGAYDTSMNRLEEARNLYQLETKGEVNYIYLIASNWKKILLGLLLASITGIIAYYRYRLYRIESRLEEIDQEENSIHEMKKQDQKEAFEQGDMSINEYEDAAEDYNEDLIQLIEERTKLESKKANITNFREEDSLRQQRDKLKDIIQDTQEDYVKGDIADTGMYETKVEELTEKLSTIESRLAEKEAKSRHKSSRIPFR